MVQPTIGLLPLYLELYDNAVPETRPGMEAFYARIADELRALNLQVLTSPICRVEPEFATAVTSFEDAGADAIVTLHLAYSPSLESAPALAATRLPVIVLDTTPDAHYGPDQDPSRLMYNHGIHGVQDLCNLLIRHRKPFQIEAGHWQTSDVLQRVADWAHAARLATRMRTARVGYIGEPFTGMGDFAVPEHVLRRTIGVESIACDPAELRALVPPADDPEVCTEIEADRDRFNAAAVDAEAHRRSVQTGLAVRRWIESEKLSAFTFNFLAFDRAFGLPTAPFLEASKSMARGIGYAGERDVLTAALVGALCWVHPDTTFTEIFCPDWADDRIFVSHMGEVNVDLLAGGPRLKEMDFKWTDAQNPVFAVGRLIPGEAVLVNLAPGPDDTYTLLVAPVMMLDVAGPDNMVDSVHGWFQPRMPIVDFLAEYSRVGGTHHSALVYRDVAKAMVRFGQLMGWRIAVLDGGS